MKCSHELYIVNERLRESYSIGSPGENGYILLYTYISYTFLQDMLSQEGCWVDDEDEFFGGRQDLDVIY